jgi:hypothetical protein
VWGVVFYVANEDSGRIDGATVCHTAPRFLSVGITGTGGRNTRSSNLHLTVFDEGTIDSWSRTEK